METYTITSGTYNCEDYKIEGSYKSLAWLIKKAIKLNYNAWLSCQKYQLDFQEHYVYNHAQWNAGSKKYTIHINI